MYKYNLIGKAISVASVILLLALIFIVQDLFIRIIFILIVALMLKDAISVFTTVYYVNEEGLYKKDAFKNRQICTWQNLLYITITRRNKDWVALVRQDDSISYLKKRINNRRGLLLDMLSYAKKNKNLAIHDVINEKYSLGLNLNDQGKIRREN